jgi:hypothetical protein
MKLIRGPDISEFFWFRLGEVEDKAYDVSPDVRIRWGMFSDGIRDPSREHRGLTRTR